MSDSRFGSGYNRDPGYLPFKRKRRPLCTCGHGVADHSYRDFVWGECLLDPEGHCKAYDGKGPLEKPSANLLEPADKPRPQK